MRGTLKPIWSAVLLTLVLAGCSSTSSPNSTSTTSTHAANSEGSQHNTTIKFKSPAVVHGALQARYTCDGEDVSPPLEWGAVPAHTKVLAVFILGLKTSPSSAGSTTASVEWSLANIDPALHKLAAGEQPPGAYVGDTPEGKKHSYSVCPAKGHAERYEFVVYAVPASITIPSKFASVDLLEAIASRHSSTSSKAGGDFFASYKRG